MRALIQRVTEASVVIDGKVHSAIGAGMLILFCVETGDGESELEWMLKKITNLRIFDDDNGVMNRSILDTDGEGMVVSQFTLAANVKKGNRPSYINAARPEEAVPMYERFCKRLSEIIGKRVGTGVFGADMKVSLTNDGPVTIWLDTGVYNKKED